MSAPSITCPRCGRTSHNPNDVEQGYCGACHDWTAADPFLTSVRRARAAQEAVNALGAGPVRPGSHRVEVRVAQGPDGRRRVLPQLEDGWTLMTAHDARNAAAALTDTAADLDRLNDQELP